MTTTLLAFAIVILFMAAMATVYARGRNGRAAGACKDDLGVLGPCAYCDVSHRGNCKTSK